MTEPMVQRYAWASLNKQQVGAYAEYFVKMELTMHGFQVYTTEVDDRGVDFVARYGMGPFIEVQVKSLRGSGYVFSQKSKFLVREHLFLALCILTEGEEPSLYLVPALTWQSPTPVFVSRDYGGELKSPPEWGVNVSVRNKAELETFRFETSVMRLLAV